MGEATREKAADTPDVEVMRAAKCVLHCGPSSGIDGRTRD